MSEDKLQTAVSRGARAKALLEDDLVSGALNDLETSYIKAWRESHVRDTDARERLWQAVQIVGKVRDHLSLIVQNGKLAQAEIEQIAARETAA